MLYISLYAVILGWDVCHTEWCFSQAELMASLGNMSLFETAEPYEGRSLRQSCLMYMAFINTGEKYTNWTQWYMLCMHGFGIMKRNTFDYVLSHPHYSIIISMRFSENKDMPQYELNLW